VDALRERLTAALQDRYARDLLTMDEYERLLDYVARVETPREAAMADAALAAAASPPPVDAAAPAARRVTFLSANTATVDAAGGSFLTLFGLNKILVGALPRGRTTTLRVAAAFGLTEIHVPRGVRVIVRAAPVVGGVFTQGIFAGDDGDGGEDMENVGNMEKDAPALVVTGRAVCGNITIRRV